MQHLHMAIPGGWQAVAGPIWAHMLFSMPIPQSKPKKAKAAMASGAKQHTKKPDLDNLVKFVKDCANGILWRDDAQVYRLHATKVYAEEPKTEIYISWED